jgi:predicted amidophosphoribosyltransferase
MTRRLQVHIVKVPSSRWRWLWQRGFERSFERLEPCAAKVACRVLRGGCGGNVASLPDFVRFLEVTAAEAACSKAERPQTLLQLDGFLSG